MSKRWMRASLAMLILFSIVVAPTISLGADGDVPHATGVRPAANSATPDWWEDDGSPSVGWANPLTAYVPAAGDGFFTQPHTIHTALNDAYDVDWYYLTVDEDEIAIDEVKFLIEAVSLDQDVDLVIEV